MYIDIGQYLFHLKEAPSQVKNNLRLLYGDSVTDHHSSPADYSVSLRNDSWLRKIIKPQVTFYLGENRPFKPLPASQSYPVMEWGMNWCIAATDFNRLIIHAAVLVKNNKAIIFPATPGSGKSTLSAYFALSGWTLYSDEMAIVDLETLKVQPLYRPICLKNNSIDLVKQWYPHSIFTPTAFDTQKGNVAHVKAIDWHDYLQLAPVDVVAVVFPKFDQTTAVTEIQDMYKVVSIEKLSFNAFNYNVLGEQGFDCITELIARIGHLSINYNDLADVDDVLTSEFIL